MNFDFSDEQRQLHEALDRFLSQEYSFDKFRKIKDSAAGWDKQTWAGLADLGVLGLSVPAENGGLGFGALETLSMMDVCGRNLVLEPVLSSAVIATALLKQFAAGSQAGDSQAADSQAADSQAGDLLRQMAAGERISVLAHFEPDSRFEPQWVTTSAQRNGDRYVLRGHKAVVMHAAAADVLLVSARTAGEPGAARGVSLFRVAKHAPGLLLDDYPTFDGTPAADVYLQDVEVASSARLGVEGGAFAAIETSLGIGLAALCAEAVGVMQALVDATIQYLQSRQQFGQPIGKFQALQHRVADMLIHLEQARSMSYLAALRCSDANVNERRAALSACKIVVGQACRFVGQQAVQLHGGMGMTEELAVSHWFKRLMAAEIMFGDSDTHLQRYAALTREQRPATTVG